MRAPALPARMLIAALLALAALHALSGTGLWAGVGALITGAADDPALASAALAGLMLAGAGLVGWKARPGRSLFWAAALVPALFLLARASMGAAGALHPTTLTAYAYAVEQALGLPAFGLGRLLARAPVLGALGGLCWTLAPLILAAALVREERREGSCERTLLALALLVVLCSALGAIFPMAGPGVAFPDAFPWSPPGLREAHSALRGSPQLPRSAFPSLDLSVAALAALRLRRAEKPAFWGAAAAAVLAGVYLLGAGRDPAVAVLAALPAAAAADALSRWEKRAGAAALLAVCAGWLFLTSRALTRAVLVAGAVSGATRAAAFFLALVSLALPPFLARRSADRPAPAPAAPAAAIDPLAAALAVVFFLSGAAGLFYEVIFSKSLALTFGSTAKASTAVLAMYMGGMALGSWLGGALAARLRRPILGYALCELGIAGWCSFSPDLVARLRTLYVDVAAPHPSGRVLWQLLLSGAALLPATLLMGMTLPLLIRALLGRKRGLGDSVGLLYGANTLGAAAGALIAGYAALPLLGVVRTTFVAVLANALAALCGFLVVARKTGAQAPEASAAAAPEGEGEAPLASSRRLGIAALLVLLIGGTATFVLETAEIHLLAVVAGNSAYAFSLMLFAFLIGLGAGAVAGRRWLRAGKDPALGLAASEVLLALSLLLTVYRWEDLPAYFASFSGWAAASSFGAREVARSAICLSILLPPALCIGAAYPTAMECVGRSWPARKVEALGAAAALNTVGNVAGALVGGFVLLPRAGSLFTLHALAATAAVLALLPALAARGRALQVALAGCAAAALLFAAQPASFNWTAIASGSNVYFAGSAWGRVIDHAESLDGGLTTVNESTGPRGPIHVLLTNGKFQGNDAVGGEMTAQVSFALDPLRHLPRRGLALNIGFGTGTTARILQESGFARTDVVDLSADILRLADRWFEPVNGGVLRRERVRPTVADGRNFLLLSGDRYDIISLEISSIWFAGAAALYNREFYQLVKQHLAEGGVLQQWIQLHHISPSDVASVLESVRAEFAQVWLYESGGQGVVVACTGNCPPTEEAIARIESEPAMARMLQAVEMDASALRQRPLLDAAGVEKFLSWSRENAPGPISTDDNLHLEYSTPRGNARQEPQGYQAMRGLLGRFSGAPKRQ